ncbi:MAG TPA: DNA-3-methyladenine glycosylase [Candidatus Bathyarchaeia archaeon]|nr:DNA-3-methyladenine glycosylase [Candidatus Bathyarchaeia archaeon]
MHLGLRAADPDRPAGVLRDGDPAVETTPRDVLELPTLELGRALLGGWLIRDDGGTRRDGRIVEVEAYIGEDDQASHARFGRTARNTVMYGPPGIAYVYLVYGMHDCLNIVSEPIGRPAALLVRAVEPVTGIDAMRTARAERSVSRRRAAAGEDAAAGMSRAAAAAARLRSVPDLQLASGPALVAAAFDLDRSLTGTDLFDPDSPVRVEPRAATEPEPRIVAGPRVGIAYAGPDWMERPWRLSIADHPSVSRPRPGTA